LKKESRSPRGFLPRPLLRAGESIAPPPYPQKNSGGAHQEFRSKKVRANAKITPPKTFHICGIFLLINTERCNKNLYAKKIFYDHHSNFFLKQKIFFPIYTQLLLLHFFYHHIINVIVMCERVMHNDFSEAHLDVLCSIEHVIFNGSSRRSFFLRPKHPSWMKHIMAKKKAAKKKVAKKKAAKKSKKRK